MKLLLLEDNRDAARSIADGLSLMDNRYTFRFAGSLQEAVSVLRKEAFDIALADLTLPDARDCEAPVVLRQQMPDLPIVAISALQFESVALDLAQHGIQDFLPKGGTSIRRIHEVLQLAAIRHERELLLRERACRDPLTGAANRAELENQVAKAISHADRSGLHAALFLLDIDNFKAVNDLLGHQVGDEVLKNLVLRLESLIREGDTVGRLGGDEFLLVFEGLSEADDVYPIARKVHECVNFQLQLEDCYIDVSTAVGIAMFPGDSMDFNGLVKSADRAMYAAKQRRSSANGGVTEPSSLHH